MSAEMLITLVRGSLSPLTRACSNLKMPRTVTKIKNNEAKKALTLKRFLLIDIVTS
jgi:hypothetical protein